MFEKFITSILSVFCIALTCFADVVPTSANDIPPSSIGMYQVSCAKLTVYEKPSEKSKIVYEETIDFSYYLNNDKSDTYSVLLAKRQLAYLYATDCYDDWVEIIYNKPFNLKGWVKKEDIFQFLPWFNFYGMYGRKYGLVELKTDKKQTFKLYSQADENSQLLATITKPSRIRLTALEGNWALVSVLDISGTVQTGYLQWRTQEGEFFVFPSFK